MLSLICKKKSFVNVFLTGTCSSFFIEFLQGFIERDGDIDDLIFNTLGTVTGFLLYLLLKNVSEIYKQMQKQFSV